MVTGVVLGAAARCQEWRQLVMVDDSSDEQSSEVAEPAAVHHKRATNIEGGSNFGGCWRCGGVGLARNTTRGTASIRVGLEAVGTANYLLITRWET
ncbi:hypothetical protein NL676_023080 [Syzygium grande]|nr:hypothetical protein NL676_023080 [Syzygium grande]